ncbi:hypothetical protein ACWGFX_35920 [Streptomyces xanthophaeus]
MTPARARQLPARSASVRLRAVVTAAVLAALASGCSGSGGEGRSGGDGSAAPTAPGATAVTSGPAAGGAEDADRAEVRAVYDRYWGELSAAYGKGDLKETALKDLASDSVYAQKDLEIGRLRGGGHVVTGATLHSDTSVTFSVALRDGQEIRTADMRDCVDVSRRRAVDIRTGEEAPQPARPLLRYTAGVTFEKGPRGWVVVGDRMLTQDC